MNSFFDATKSKILPSKTEVMRIFSATVQHWWKLCCRLQCSISEIFPVPPFSEQSNVSAVVVVVVVMSAGNANNYDASVDGNEFIAGYS